MASGIDANILLRYVKKSHPQHGLVRAAVRKLRAQDEDLCILPQNVYEFWSVATRPTAARGGFGMSLAEAERGVRLLERIFRLLPDTPEIYDEWRRLVVAHGVSGVQAHDARLAAALRVHGVARFLTFNTPDFARYVGFLAVDPAAI